MDETSIPLAVVVYRKGEPLEEILAEVRDRLVARGDLRLGGVVPRFGPCHSNGRASLLLDDIGHGDTIALSQDLGPGSTGCILDADGLARTRVRLAEAIEAGPDVVFLGRFAKEEIAGHGIREEIGAAVVAEIAAIVAVEETMLDGWIAFAGEDWARLPADVDVITSWVTSLHPIRS